MNTIELEIKELNGQIKEMQDKVNKKSRVLFEDATASIFKEYPQLICFCWTQYTPYFNDGDPCTFGVHEPSIHFEGDGLDRDDYGWDGMYYYGSWLESKGIKKEPKHEMYAAISGLINGLNDSFFESAFGDHVIVEVTRSGVEVSEYSHD